LLVGLVAVAVSVSVRAVGVMLVSGLMILPAACGLMIGRGFKAVLFSSVLISELSVLFGFFIAYRFQLPSGAAIILTVFLILLLIWLYKSKLLCILRK
jgi:zinc transport system permease protein